MLIRATTPRSAAELLTDVGRRRTRRRHHGPLHGRPDVRRNEPDLGARQDDGLTRFERGLVEGRRPGQPDRIARNRQREMCLLRTRRATAELFLDPSPQGGLLVSSQVDLDRLVRRCRTVGVEVVVEGQVLRARSLPPAASGERRRTTPSARMPKMKTGAGE